jgi:hypothetical protein
VNKGVLAEEDYTAMQYQSYALTVSHRGLLSSWRARAFGTFLSRGEPMASIEIGATTLRLRVRKKSASPLCLFTAGLLGFCSLFSKAEAGEPYSVIELFTSQGCSSCPPADRLLAELALKPELIVLSFPIDYWDYIGWRDTLASPAFTARQRAYASTLIRANLTRAKVYTPQVVIDGLDEAAGSDRAAIEEIIAKLKADQTAMTLSIRLTDSGNSLTIEIPGRTELSDTEAGGTTARASILVLRVVHKSTVKIGRGENAGRVMTYTNVVRAIHKLGDWDGMPAIFTVPELKGDDEGYIVLLQQGGMENPGAILAAAKTAGL